MNERIQLLLRIVGSSSADLIKSSSAGSGRIAVVERPCTSNIDLRRDRVEAALDEVDSFSDAGFEGDKQYRGEALAAAFDLTGAGMM